ncbi:MAG: hypothetical protein F6K41_27240 [Symploca sp. SIO3E6]|nr:hypothetical protein [Caldora sp. SIO3E6]
MANCFQETRGRRQEAGGRRQEEGGSKEVGNMFLPFNWGREALLRSS